MRWHRLRWLGLCGFLGSGGLRLGRCRKRDFQALLGFCRRYCRKFFLMVNKKQIKQQMRQDREDE